VRALALLERHRVGRSVVVEAYDVAQLGAVVAKQCLAQEAVLVRRLAPAHRHSSVRRIRPPPNSTSSLLIYLAKLSSSNPMSTNLATLVVLGRDVDHFWLVEDQGAALFGADCCTGLGLEARGAAPVTGLS
jgi:hypothetical protein